MSVFIEKQINKAQIILRTSNTGVSISHLLSCTRSYPLVAPVQAFNTIEWGDPSATGAPPGISKSCAKIRKGGKLEIEQS